MEVQKKYAPTGKFTVFLSYVQGFNNAAESFLKGNAPMIPCYNQVNLPHAPCGRGIPHAVLFDYTGKVVAQGSPSQLLQQVEALIKATPDPPAAILGGVEPVYCKSYAQKLADGKAIIPVLKLLLPLSKKEGEKGEEAQKLIEAAKAYVKSEQERLVKDAEISPAMTMYNLNKFYIQVRGFKCEQEVKALLYKIKKDRYANSLYNIIKKVKTTQAKIAKKCKSTKSDDRAFKKAKESIDKLINTKGVSEVVAEEAKKFKDSF